MIQISKRAAEQIHSLKNKEHKQNDFLRIAVKEGGCSGFSYKLDFEPIEQTKDKTFEAQGVKVVIDAKSLLYLMGTTLDFDGGLNGKGFIFSNPNAKKSCGCGFSFGV